MPVVVVVAHGDTHAVTPAPRKAVDPGLPGDVAKGAIPLVAKEAVAWLRVPIPRHTQTRGGVGGCERPPLHAVHVEPAVPVEIDEAHAA